ncbi:MAG TPA: hypothetical protein VHN14_22870, partial [Kofleriaceae bacterium]|nr:hypothetical protein [Kofleriaceae bacterium]
MRTTSPDILADGRSPPGYSVRAAGIVRGRVTVNVEPAPGSLSTVIVPPCATTIDRAMYNP